VKALWQERSPKIKLLYKIALNHIIFAFLRPLGGMFSPSDSVGCNSRRRFRSEATSLWSQRRTRFQIYWRAFVPFTKHCHRSRTYCRLKPQVKVWLNLQDSWIIKFYHWNEEPKLDIFWLIAVGPTWQRPKRVKITQTSTHTNHKQKYTSSISKHFINRCNFWKYCYAIVVLIFLGEYE